MYEGGTLRTVVSLACLALGVAAAPAHGYFATYTDVHGHAITVFEPTHGPNTARDQLVVETLESLVHGDEMNLLTIDFTTSDAGHNDECNGAAACYSFGSSPGRIHLRGFDTGDDPESEADNGPLTAQNLPRGVIAHEYGHHVANHRFNDGALAGGASTNGTKRWASHMRICPRVKRGRLGGRGYVRSPGEGFAEAYRAANSPGVLGTWLLDPVLTPDATALALVREDVLSPYAGPRSTRLHGRFRAGGRDQRVKTVRTPLDGRLTATLETTGSLDARLVAMRGHDRVARARRATQRLSYEVCGARRLALTVERIGGVGRYTLDVSRP